MLEQRFDIVQVCNLPDILILTVVLPKLLGAKALFDAHDGTPEGLMIQKGYRAESLVVRLATLFERLAFALADEAITVHEAIRQHFMQRGANGDKISVVMNVPDREVFFDTRTKPAGTCRETFTLIYAGSITRPYGLDTAIRALPLLYEIANLRLRIIGRGNYQAQLAYLAEELGVSGKISFEPPVPQEQVRTLYQQADIGISPHTGGLFGEICFSNKVSEYLAVGLPAVVSRTPVYEHYFDDRHVSFCTPDDPQSFAGCVRKIYEHPDYRRSLVQNGLERIQQLSWQNEKERYLAVIDRLAGKDVTDASPLR
jgi:glycosyltransferase involved in cell wall biosynthesis